MYMWLAVGLPAPPPRPWRSFCESLTTGQENLLHWSYVHKNTSTWWHFRWGRYSLHCSWDPLSWGAQLRKGRERKKERNFPGCAAFCKSRNYCVWGVFPLFMYLSIYLFPSFSRPGLETAPDPGSLQFGSSWGFAPLPSPHFTVLWVSF